MDSNNEVQTLHTSAISPIRREPYLHEPVTVIDEARGKPVPAIVHDVLPRDNFGHARVSVNAFTDSGVVVYSNLRLFNPPLAGSRPGDRSYAVRTCNHDCCFGDEAPANPPEPGNGEFEDGFHSTNTPANDPPAPASSEATPDAPAESATAESTTTETCPAEAAAS